MTKDEALDYFNENIRPYIYDFHGPWVDYCTVYENDNDRYSFILGYDLYNCEATYYDCDNCPSKNETEHECCYEKQLYIRDDGTIYFDEKIYSESEFEQLKYDILL